jgi:CBS domain-containing protein/GNAT superfamily N-acetyltransferase
MNLKLEETTIYSFPHAFISKKGEPILVTTLDDKRYQRLIEMYLAYQPRNSFQGLPPIKDEACVKWVQHLIGHGINLVALSFGEGVVGHTVLFPIDNLICEMLVVVTPPLQNTGIGTELVRCVVQLAHEIGFEKIHLTVEATNVRARRVYKKCGFDYLSRERGGQRGELDMALDLKRYRDTVNVSVATIMNKDVIVIRDDQPCQAALQIFLAHRVGSLPVVDEKGELVGIISKTDLLVPSKIGKRVSDVLTREVLTVQEGCPLAKVIRILQSRGIRAIPVVDRYKKLLGIVGREDILTYYAKHLSSSEAVQ